jgi:uncharacterized protein (TIGR03032 family)
MFEPSPPGDANQAEDPQRLFGYTSADDLAGILDRIGCSLLVSTYQAGRVVAVGVYEGKAALTLHSFDYAMGMAPAPERIAVASLSQVWLLEGQHEFAPRMKPAGRFDACFVARTSHVTGEIRIHELAWVGRELWFVNTLFSCLCALGPEHSFVPRWKPPFVGKLAAEDRCHLNGMAVSEGRVLYATALAESDSAEGWRPHKAAGGCLIDVPGNVVVARGLSMPHSPRVHAGRIWLLDSGRGHLVSVDPSSGRPEIVAELPGYPRGLSIWGPYAFVGLSRGREGRGFEGTPLASRSDQLKAGVAAVELASGRLAACLEFTSGVHETFDVQVLPGIRRPAICGPFPSRDGSQPAWIIPQTWIPR